MKISASLSVASRERPPSTVSVRRALIVIVQDDGRTPASDAAPAGAGIGLANVRERLRAFYGDRAELRTECGDDGFRAELSVPLEFAR